VEVSRYDVVTFLQEPPVFDPHGSKDFQDRLLHTTNVLSMGNLEKIERLLSEL
jgi:hypothetical protein